MDPALESGINFFDTANVYGGTETEQIIGRWFAQGGGRREKTVLATKVYGGGRPVAEHVAAVGAAHPPGVRRQPAPPADRSHRPLPDAPRRPRHAVGRDLAGDGPARRPGQGDLRRQLELRRLAHRPGQRGRHAGAARSGWCPSRACTTSTPARSSSRCCRRARPTGVGVIPWSPLGGGLLGGALRKVTEGRRARRAASRPGSSATATSSKRGSRSAPSSGEEPADVALAWLLHQPAVTAPIIGPRTAEQLTGALGALEITLEHDTLDAPRQDLPRPRRRRPRGLRLVGLGQHVRRSLRSQHDERLAGGRRRLLPSSLRQLRPQHRCGPRRRRAVRVRHPLSCRRSRRVAR